MESSLSSWDFSLIFCAITTTVLLLDSKQIKMKREDDCDINKKLHKRVYFSWGLRCNFFKHYLWRPKSRKKTDWQEEDIEVLIRHKSLSPLWLLPLNPLSDETLFLDDIFCPVNFDAQTKEKFIQRIEEKEEERRGRWRWRRRPAKTAPTITRDIRLEYM